MGCRDTVVFPSLCNFDFMGGFPQRLSFAQGQAQDMEMKVNTKLIKALREERAWSQEHLAMVAGLSTRTVQRLETDGNASPESRMAIAAAFGVEPARLISEQEPAIALPAQAAVVQGLPPFDVARIALWTAILIVLLLMAGYGVGKDLAFRDNRRDTGSESFTPSAPSAGKNQGSGIPADS